MKDKFIRAHMNAALVYANLSYCRRKQVGCIVVKDDRIISIGYNGTPAGWDNICEGEDGLTIPEVIHAERNALGKLMRSHDSAEGADLFVTLKPCFTCATEIMLAGISRVYYLEEYGDDPRVEAFLKKNNIQLKLVKLED